jgi:hypothetical protein
MAAPTVTVIQLEPSQLQAMLDAAVEKALESFANKTGQEIGVKELAKLLDCSERTVRNRELAGTLPSRHGSKWLKADILRWQRDRHASR